MLAMNSFAVAKVSSLGHMIQMSHDETPSHLVGECCGALIQNIPRMSHQPFHGLCGNDVCTGLVLVQRNLCFLKGRKEMWKRYILGCDGEN